jgi:hypothetical protein
MPVCIGVVVVIDVADVVATEDVVLLTSGIPDTQYCN